MATAAGQARERARGRKSAAAFRTISEVAEDLDVPAHVLRFWETKFTTVKPLKRGGGRRYYRPEDVELLRGIRRLLYDDKYTIKGVQQLLKANGGKLPAPGAGGPSADEAEESVDTTAQLEFNLSPGERDELREILTELKALRGVLDRGSKGPSAPI